MGEKVRFSLHVCCQEMQSELEEWLADKGIETFREERLGRWERILARCPNFSSISYELHVEASILLDVPKIQDGLLPCLSSPKKITSICSFLHLYWLYPFTFFSPDVIFYHLYFIKAELPPMQPHQSASLRYFASFINRLSIYSTLETTTTVHLCIMLLQSAHPTEYSWTD